jgi:Starch-binding associating with outer membrane
MKKLVKINLVLLLCVSFVGCAKFEDFGDTNVDPNRTLVPSTNALLTNTLAGIGTRQVQLSPGYFAQYFAETQYPTASLYGLPQFNMDGIYAGALQDCQKIIDFNSDPATAAAAAGSNFVNGTNANQIATARILKAYYYWTITDSWGDVPYSEALKFPIIQPKFDKQEDIYKGILTELTQAVAQFDGGNIFKGDIVYNGNNAQWKKLANSLRMLIALRMSKRYPGASEYAAVQFNAALNSTAGYITSNADNFKIVYPGGALPNPWTAQYAGGRKDLGEAEPFVNLLLSLGDARQTSFKYGSSNIGVPFGRNRIYMNGTWGAIFDADGWSRVLGNAYRADNAALNLVHASMVYFARAEAKFMGWTSETPTPEQLYNAGIDASFTMWDLTSAQATAYYNGPNVLYTTGANQLQKIQLQRYIALYPDGIQGWSEWRRTGVPALVPAIDALNGGVIPRRFVYGANDYNTNAVNVQAAVTALGGDTEKLRVWWDKP